MTPYDTSERVLTELDHVRLAGLLRRADSEADTPLDEWLDSADLVSSRDVRARHRDHVFAAAARPTRPAARAAR